MTIRHLKIFIAVAEYGKMNQAAKALFISQPSVSQAIRELETHYGVLLFERLSQKLYITDAGLTLLPQARHIVDSFETMELMMRDAGKHPRLRIGASISIGTCLFGDVAARIEAAIPGLDLQVVVDNTENIESMITNSQLDAGVVEGRIDTSDVAITPIGEDSLVIVVGAKHPFWERSTITLDELQGQSIIAREDSSKRRSHYEQILSEHGIVLHAKWICTNTEAIKNAVIHGRSLAILSSMIVADAVAAGQLRIIPVTDIEVKRQLKLILHRNKFITPALKCLIDILQAGLH